MSDETRQFDIRAIVDALPDPQLSLRRIVVAIAGPPASGKSTLAAQLCAALGGAAVVGMDAFHLDNAVLEARGDLARKGAPHTFDAAGYAHLISRLRAKPTEPIAVPVFDRTLELTRNAAEVVDPDDRIVITEGNYLLLDADPWTRMAPSFDLTVWIDVPLSTVEERIMGRWIGHGHNISEAAQRLITNDLPNAQLVQSRSRRADIVVRACDH